MCKFEVSISCDKSRERVGCNIPDASSRDTPEGGAHLGALTVIKQTRNAASFIAVCLIYRMGNEEVMATHVL